jgi:hypothetical protein
MGTFQKAVGTLLYLSATTRPDIAYAVSKVSQFSKNPGILLWGKSSEQTIESEIPIRLHVKCSAYCFPPEGYRKSVKSRIFGLIFYLLL